MKLELSKSSVTLEILEIIETLETLEKREVEFS